MSARAAVALAVAVAVTGGLAVGCGGSGDETKSGARRTGARTLHLIHRPGPPGVAGNFQPIFHGRTEFEPGDSFIIWDELEGDGHAQTYCVIAQQQPRRTFRCSRTYVLPAGQIVAVGAYDNSPGGADGTIPVVGGTGAYEGVHGSVTVRGGRRGGRITIHLR